MKLVQKILSHGLFIAVIVAAFLVYTKRADLFPQWFGASHTAAGRSTSDKLAAAKPDTGALPPAHSVTRPLPEKTLIKKEVVPPVPEKLTPAGTEEAPVEQQQPAGSDSVAPAPGEPAEQSSTDAAPAGAGTASSAAGSEMAAEQTASGDASAPPIFRPLDDEQQAEKPEASIDVAAPAGTGQAAAQNAEPAAAEPGQQAPQEQAAQEEQTTQEQAAQETAAQEQAAQEQAAQETAAQEQAAQEQAAQEPPAQEQPAQEQPSQEQPSQEQATQDQATQEQATQEQANHEQATQAQATQEPPAQTQMATATPTASAAAPAAASGAASESGPQTNPEDARLQQQLERAREFYWQRDLRDAASAYQSLGEAYPENAEVWGEIGNFYFSLRRGEQAGAAYSHAIELLMQNNDPVRARQLLGVLFRLDARKARELETRLQQAGG